MSILVYSTKAIKCKGDNETFPIPCHVITSAPEWVAETDEFKLGRIDGCLTVTDTKETKIAAENGDLADGKAVKGNAKGNAKGTNKEKIEDGNKEVTNQVQLVDENKTDK